MPEVIILSDTVLNGELGSMRYMGAYAVASALRKENISTVVVDYFTRIPDLFSYLETLVSEETIAIGVSSTFLAPFLKLDRRFSNRSEGLAQFYNGELWFENGEDLKKWTQELKQKVQRINPRVKLILGGVKSQFSVWRPAFYEDFDYVCIGAADKSFPEFIKQLKNNNEIKTQAIQGRSGVIDNRQDLLDKQCPEAHWIQEDFVQPHEALPIEISRGCVFNCKFCHYDKKESFKKNTQTLYNEFIRNYENFGTTVYSFCDDCFNDHPQKVEIYCNLFKSLPFKIEWTAYSRVDVAVKYPHTVDLMVESGARGLYWGIESFHPVVARMAGKGTPPELVKNFLLEFRKKYKGLCLSEGSFIVGLPGEDRSSILATLDWLVENDSLDLATFGPLGLMPYVQSLDKVLFDYAEYSKNPEKFGFTEVRFKPHYWAHKEMDSVQAQELAILMAKTWSENAKRGYLRSIWLYPHARTLGLNHEKAIEAFTSESKYNYYQSFLIDQFARHISNYHHDLLSQKKDRVDSCIQL